MRAKSWKYDSNLRLNRKACCLRDQYLSQSNVTTKLPNGPWLNYLSVSQNKPNGMLREVHWKYFKGTTNKVYSWEIWRWPSKLDHLDGKSTYRIWLIWSAPRYDSCNTISSTYHWRPSRPVCRSGFLEVTSWHARIRSSWALYTVYIATSNHRPSNITLSKLQENKQCLTLQRVKTEKFSLEIKILTNALQHNFNTAHKVVHLNFRSRHRRSQ